MEQNINRIIDKSHFKSFNKVYPIIQEQYPDITADEVQNILKKRSKDPYRMEKKMKPYQVKIFSQSPDTWFHDLFDNTNEGDPRYFHIFIGTNSRYAVVKPLADKNANSVLRTITEFVEEFDPVKLTSDEEAAFKSERVCAYLESKDILVMFIEDSNHTSLGIIDRFIRTLRDMNTAHETSKSQSHDVKYRVFTEARMKKLVNIYNNTYHNSIHCTPKEMHENFGLERDYILECLKRREKQKERISDFEMKVGDWVRYVLPRHNGKTKKRYRLSKEKYRIEERVGNMYTIIANDGTILTRPRHKLVLAGDREKFAQTFPGRNTGVVTEIISKVGNKYRVKFTVPGGDGRSPE